MPSTERETSRDSERLLKHQQSSSSDSGRAIVPMWDSSDPIRAPPPLPMNPSSPKVSASRPHTSSAIQSAHAALSEKARASDYITNPPPKRIEPSPERSLIKGAAHKRMQSLHTGHVRDLSNFLEGGGSASGSPRSPEKSSPRPPTPHANRDFNKDFLLGAKMPEKLHINKEFFPEGRSPERISREFLSEGRSPDKASQFLFAPDKLSKDLLFEGRPQEKPSREYLLESRSPEREKMSSRSSTPTPNREPRESPMKDTPTIRPSLRRPPQSILGENTPPQSATMLALQNMAMRDAETPLSSVTNGSTALVRGPQTFDAISNQLLSLTSIATSLQREMAQLSRRSKDNATDLVSLKEATNARDEDIRKSLRELVQNLSESNYRPSTGNGTNNVYGHSLFLDSKPHNSPGSRAVKNFTLPRIPSPNSFAASLDRESMATPSSFSPDGAATGTLLEKIVREMGTKEGQENLLSRLTDIADRLGQDGSSTSRKVDELITFIKSNTTQDLISQHNGGGPNGNRPRTFSFEDPPVLELDFDQSKSGHVMQRVEAMLSASENGGNNRGSGSANALDEESVKIIKSIKDSVAQGGGLTAEVKALVRELRGEVLGMGREMGRKIDEAGSKPNSSDDAEAMKDHVARVVQDGLDDLKGHLERVLHEHQVQLESSEASRNTVDYQEIYNAMHSAINEKEPKENTEIGREEMIEVIKEVWENYKPELQVQTFGLERDELLACLKDGLQQYAPDSSQAIGGATRDEVFSAVVEGLKHFSPPKLETPPSLSREEILDAIRECLEEFEFPSAPPLEPREGELTRDDMVIAVKESITSLDLVASIAAASAALGRDGGPEVTKQDMRSVFKEVLQSFDFTAARGGPADSGIGISEELTRDDILSTVHESIEAAAAAVSLSKEPGEGVSRDSILGAMNESLSTFDFSTIATAVTKASPELTREDIADALTESLSNFDFSTVISAMTKGGQELTRDEILDVVKEGLQNADSTAHSTALTREIGGELTRADVFEAVKSGLREQPPLEAFAGQVLEKLQGIAESIRNEFQAVSDEAKQNVSANGRDTEQLLDATKDGFEKLRADIEVYIDHAADTDGKNEILAAIRENFDTLRQDFQENVSKGPETALETVQGELEHLRETLASSLVRNGGTTDKNEILDALREGLDGIRAELNRPRESTESILSGSGEILDALQDGLSGLKAEVEKIANTPVDMTINHEILSTLKTGIESVRADIDALKAQANEEHAVAEISDRSIVTTDGLKRHDITNLEVLITQLRIKVDTLESIAPPPPVAAPGSLSKTDLAHVEELLRTVQQSVSRLTAAEGPVHAEGIKREDMEAIETLLRNTKAKIDEFDFEKACKKDDLDVVEALALETRDDMSRLATHLEDVSKRDEVSIVEALVRDIVVSLDDMKERASKELENPDRVTKTDVEAVEALCLQVKGAIEQMVSNDIVTLATKDDVKSVEDLVKGFRDQVEMHAATNAKAFEERQAETVGVGVGVSEVHTSLQELRDALKAKLDEGAINLDSLRKFLEGVGETIGQNANITHDVKEMFETMKTEFENCNAGVAGSKLETDEKFQQTWDKFDSKIDEKINELISKFDDGQAAAEARAQINDERTEEIEASMLGTKVVAEELKSLVDTLGTSMTDSVEKMDEASKTVFGRVEETYTKIQEHHSENKAEHQTTRDEVAKTLGGIEGVRGYLTEYNPKMVESIKDVLLIVGQHYEHSKNTCASIEQKIEAIPPPVEIPPFPEIPERYDDSQVQEKLDKLVDHTHVAGKSFSQLAALDKIHQQVMQTSAELSTFLASQTLRIEEEHEDKEKAAEAAGIALERRLAEKEAAEASIARLKGEEDRLRASVSSLKAESDDLIHQKMRLAADVSSLETALRIRQEELQAMEARAEGLERRILDGVIDHSRALLLSKQNKGRDTMSRKRVPSHAPSMSSVGSRASHTTQSAVNMAMGGNRAMNSVPINNPAGPSRRILSLSQITHNVPTGGAGAGFKRSHSVKAPNGATSLRKSSWGGSNSKSYGELNKENLALKESEEDDELAGSEPEEAGQQQLMRRSSRGTTILAGTEKKLSEPITEGTTWSESTDGEDHLDSAGTEPSSIVLYEKSGELV